MIIKTEGQIELMHTGDGAKGLICICICIIYWTKAIQQFTKIAITLSKSLGPRRQAGELKSIMTCQIYTKIVKINR